MSNASKEGREAFFQALRRRSFFPTHNLCGKLYEQTLEFFQAEDIEKLTIEYDDAEAFPKEDAFELDVDEDVELDDIIDDDGDTNEDELKEIDTDNDSSFKFTPEDLSEHEN